MELWRHELYENELFHHGIKGQKWGVRRGPPYPLNKNVLTSNGNTAKIINEAINNSRVSLTVNPEKQERHILGSGYIKGRSYIFGDLKTAQKLINKLHGTGKLLFDKKGNWKQKEHVSAKRIIGVYIDESGTISFPTKEATIIYSKSGTHIFPRRGEQK